MKNTENIAKSDLNRIVTLNVGARVKLRKISLVARQQFNGPIFVWSKVSL